MGLSKFLVIINFYLWVYLFIGGVTKIQQGGAFVTKI